MAAPRFAVRPSLAELWFVRGLPWSARLEFYRDADRSEPWDLTGHEFAGGLVVGGEVAAPFSTDGSDLANGVLVLSLTGEQTDRETDVRWWLNDGDAPLFDGPALPGEPGRAGLRTGGATSADVTVHLGAEVVVVATPLPGSGGGEGGTSDHTQLANLDAPDQHPMEAVIGLTALVDELGSRNAPNGYPGLTAAGLLLENQIPASIARDSEVASGLASKLATTGGGLDVVHDLGEMSGDVVVDFADGNSQHGVLAGNVTDLSFTGATAGRECQLVLEVTQDDTPRAVVWDTAVDWGAAGPPTLSEDAGASDVFVFRTRDGGATVHAAVVGQGFGA